MAYDPNLRASDADRDRVAALLREHHAAGRLSVAEFSERLDRTFSAVTVGELDQLLADLPGIDLYRLPDASLTRRPKLSQGGRQAGGSSAWRAAWGGWLSVTLVCFVIWLLAGRGYVWPLWVAGPWGAAMAGGWLTENVFRGRPRRGLGNGRPGPHQLPGPDDDLPGRAGR